MLKSVDWGAIPVVGPVLNWLRSRKTMWSLGAVLALMLVLTLGLPEEWEGTLAILIAQGVVVIVAAIGLSDAVLKAKGDIWPKFTDETQKWVQQVKRIPFFGPLLFEILLRQETITLVAAFLVVKLVAAIPDLAPYQEQLTTLILEIFAALLGTQIAETTGEYIGRNNRKGVIK